eukprot:3365534-Amphidinium_carterae.1
MRGALLDRWQRRASWPVAWAAATASCIACVGAKSRVLGLPWDLAVTLLVRGAGPAALELVPGCCVLCTGVGAGGGGAVRTGPASALTIGGASTSAAISTTVAAG